MSDNTSSTYPKPVSNSTDPKKERFETWMKELLDLSLRNKLLNFRKGRSVSLDILDLQFFIQNLEAGRSIKILSSQDSIDTPNLALFEDSLPENPPQNIADRASNKDSVLAKESESVAGKNLIELFRDARTALQESGANILYLAIGFLSWSPTDSKDKSYKAPLILLPISLVRPNARSPFTIKTSDEEASFNPALLEMLKDDFALRLNKSIIKSNLPKIVKLWDYIRSETKDIDGWEVTEDIVISTFSFSKYLMWRDIKEFGDKLKKHRLIQRLIKESNNGKEPKRPFPSPNDFKAGEFDKHIDPSELFCPLPVDSSQLAAVLASKQDKDFILKGPPGTGKSQTIANIIAQSLSEGRTVLFVSEKMAALDVVYRRLKEVGLGNFCLELHSNKARKSDVINQLNDAWHSSATADEQQWEAEIKKLKNRRDNLNQYVQRLHYKHKNGLSIFDAIGTISQNSRLPIVSFNWDLPKIHNFSDLEKIRETLKDLQVHAHSVGATPLANHPLRLIGRTDYSPNWRSQLTTEVKDLLSLAQEAHKAAQELTKALGIPSLDFTPSIREGLSLLAQVLPMAFGHNWIFALKSNSEDLAEKLLLASTQIRQFHSLNIKLTFPFPDSLTGSCEREHANLFSNIGFYKLMGKETLAQDTLDSIDSYKQKFVQIAQHQAALCASYSEFVENLDIDELNDDWDRATKSAWPKSWLRKRHVRRELRPGVTGKVPSDLTTDLKNWKALRTIRHCLEEKRTRIEQALSEYSSLTEETKGLWQDKESNVSEIEHAYHFHAELRKPIALLSSNIENVAILKAALKLLMDREAALLKPDDEISKRCTHFLAVIQAFHIKHHAFAQIGHFHDNANQTWEAASIGEIIHYCQEIIQAEGQLPQWCGWREAHDKAINLNLDSLVQAIEKNQISLKEVLPVFETSYARLWLNTVIYEEPTIRRFISNIHENHIIEFKNSDTNLTALTKDLLRARLCAKLPKSNQLSANDEWRTLLREINKKTRHMPLRELFARIPNALTMLTPCLLMSPISISQYLRMDAPPFDLVIFDEASQIPPCDAIGAIARGKQVIMVGDQKQLPPTSFFDRTQNEKEEKDDISDMESILDECLTVPLDSCQLNWHYRSRHESLIAFSNRQYYGEKLITFPSPETDDRAVSVQFVKGTHNKGGDRTNIIEAQAVVDEMVSRLLDTNFRKSNQTLGIVTLNRPQQQLIEDLLDNARRKHSQIESYFSEDAPEPIFVKNLENVQGDERDIIYFSLTYGPNEDGRLLLGSLQQLTRLGGERRLNVAITRARNQMRIFSSFRPEQIDLNRSKAEGIRDLKHFLEFAERGKRALVESNQGSVGDHESPFEEAVAERLKAHGWRVDPQIGVSGFRIDLGVVDPDAPGRYLAGIECDGATYHRSATAKDRDKLRQQILENLGWKIFRVWSTDWWQDERSALNKLHDQLRTTRLIRQAERDISAANTGAP